MSNDVECAQIRLRGAVERLLIVVQHESVRNYEIALMTVQCRMAEYRQAEMNALDSKTKSPPYEASS